MFIDVVSFWNVLKSIKINAKYVVTKYVLHMNLKSVEQVVQSSLLNIYKAYTRNWQGTSIKILLLRESKANICSTLRDTWLANFQYLTKYGQFIKPYMERNRMTHTMLDKILEVYLKCFMNTYSEQLSIINGCVKTHLSFNSRYRQLCQF